MADVLFSEDGITLVSASQSGTVRLWSVKRAGLIGVLLSRLGRAWRAGGAFSTSQRLGTSCPSDISALRKTTWICCSGTRSDPHWETARCDLVGRACCIDRTERQSVGWWKCKREAASLLSLLSSEDAARCKRSAKASLLEDLAPSHRKSVKPTKILQKLTGKISILTHHALKKSTAAGGALRTTNCQDMAPRCYDDTELAGCCNTLLANVLRVRAFTLSSPGAGAYDQAEVACAAGLVYLASSLVIS